jgi:pimeloyl-ACP methyl ester carboxylesterase
MPLGLPQILVIGRHDRNWAAVGKRYYEAAKASGDDVRLVEAPESGHFEMIDPDSTTWPLVRDAVRELLGLMLHRLPPNGTADLYGYQRPW